MFKAKCKVRPRYKGKGKGKTLIGYYAEFYDPDRSPPQKRIALGTKDETSARQRVTEMEREAALGLFDPWVDPVRRSDLTFEEAKKRFIASREGRSQKTVNNYEAILRILGESLPAGVLATQVNLRHLRKFLDKESLNETSRDTYLRHLNVFFRWAKKERLIEANPAEALKERTKGVRKQKRLPKYLTEKQVSTLIEHLLKAGANPNGDGEREEEAEGKEVKKSKTRSNGSASAEGSPHEGGAGDGPNPNQWLADIVTFTVNTGLRRGEVCSLRWGAISLSERKVEVRNSHGFKAKSGEERTIFLAGDALAVIERRAAERTSDDETAFVFTRPDGTPLNGDFLSKQFRKYADDAKLPKGSTFHGLRHTFGSWAVMRGMDIYRLMEVMGHSSIEVTRRYAHLAPHATRSDMEKFFGEDRKEPLEKEVERLRKENEALKAEVELLRERAGEAANEASEAPGVS